MAQAGLPAALHWAEGSGGRCRSDLVRVMSPPLAAVPVHTAVKWCAREDLHLHGLAATRLSTSRVCCFRHERVRLGGLAPPTSCSQGRWLAPSLQPDEDWHRLVVSNRPSPGSEPGILTAERSRCEKLSWPPAGLYQLPAGSSHWWTRRESNSHTLQGKGPPVERRAHVVCFPARPIQLSESLLRAAQPLALLQTGAGASCRSRLAGSKAPPHRRMHARSFLSLAQRLGVEPSPRGFGVPTAPGALCPKNH